MIKMSARPVPTKYQCYLAAFFSVILWGTSFAVVKFVMPVSLNILAFTALQTFIGTIFLFVLLGIKGELKAWFAVLRRNNWKYLLIGICCYSGAYLVQYWGLSLTTAINQSVISNTQTFWVLAFNVWVFKSRPSRIFIGGSFLAFFGVVVLLSTPGNFFSFSTATIIGDLISILAFVLWGAYTSFSQPLSVKEPPIHVIASIFFWGNLVLVPFLFLFGGWSQIEQVTLIQWGIMVYLGIGCASLVLILWAIGLSNPAIPSEKISLITMLTPLVGIITSVLLLGETLTPNAILGCTIILGGMFIANWDEYSALLKRKPAKN